MEYGKHSNDIQDPYIVEYGIAVQQGYPSTRVRTAGFRKSIIVRELH